MTDTWPTRQRVIHAVQDLVHACHRVNDAAQAGAPIPSGYWAAVAAAGAALDTYVKRTG